MIGYERGAVDGLFVGSPSAVDDERGWLAPVFDAAALVAAGGPDLAWVEALTSCSARGVVRGLHLRRDRRQWKLARVARGAVLDVVVDLRPESATFRRVVTVELSATDRRHVVIPPGCAHGVQALVDGTELVLASSVAADPASDTGVRFDDPELAIAWPVRPPIVGARDATLPLMRQR